MIVAHLIGGNEIKGFSKGIVFINGKQLETSYEDLASVCGSISLGDLDTSLTTWRNAENVQNDYIKLVQDLEIVKDFDENLGEEFVIKNHLTEEICYSEYEIDFENKSLVLKIETYE